MWGCSADYTARLASHSLPQLDCVISIWDKAPQLGVQLHPAPSLEVGLTVICYPTHSISQRNWSSILILLVRLEHVYPAQRTYHTALRFIALSRLSTASTGASPQPFRYYWMNSGNTHHFNAQSINWDMQSIWSRIYVRRTWRIKANLEKNWLKPGIWLWKVHIGS